MAYCSNRADEQESLLAPGNYGLSNALLDCPWKKVQRGKTEFEQVMTSVGAETTEAQLTDALMRILTDDTK